MNSPSKETPLRRVAEGLRKLREARLVEAEALGVLIDALPGFNEFGTSLRVGDGAEDDYLSVRQLASRIPYAEKTIRNLMDGGVLVEGKHYFKRRRRIMFSWNAMRDWIEERGEVAVAALPVVRRRHRGG